MHAKLLRLFVTDGLCAIPTIAFLYNTQRVGMVTLAKAIRN